MKLIPALLLLCAHTLCYAQQQQFDLVRYTVPKNWKKESSASAVQLSTENTRDGSYCVIMIMKSLPGEKNARNNFNAAWETVVKELVKVTSAPQVQDPSVENGWEAISGVAPFENEGQKGVALLVTSTGYDKMVNILILTNSNSYESQMTAFLESVSLDKPAGGTNTGSQAGKSVTAPPSSGSTKAINDGFAFSTTNFDDGWTGTVQSDWVEVTKGQIKVLLHYPKEGTIIPADPEPHVVNAWNILVAPRYSNLRNFRTAYISTYDRPYLGMGSLTDNKTGKSVYVVFFRRGSSGWIEVVSPDKNSFIQQYRFDPETIQWDSETDWLTPLANMASYNKFAVAASDLRGNWTSDFTGMQQMYNVYTGQYAGMNVHQSSQTFQFGSGQTYNWNLVAVNGMVGNMKFDNAKSSGKFTVPNNWQIRFSDIERKPKTYHAHFSCIKGGRILHLLDAEYPGNGMYTSFGLKK